MYLSCASSICRIMRRLTEIKYWLYKASMFSSRGSISTLVCVTLRREAEVQHL